MSSVKKYKITKVSYYVITQEFPGNFIEGSQGENFTLGIYVQCSIRQIPRAIKVLLYSQWIKNLQQLDLMLHNILPSTCKTFQFKLFQE
jgi:hypothetical protein